MRIIHETICYTFAISTFITCVIATKDHLVLVQAVFRHGDRSPLRTYPNDKYRNYWKEGLGKLTQEGMRQEYRLGKFLRRRYGGDTFLGSQYNQSEILIISSHFNRTWMSAYCVLSGLYPINGTDQMWTPDLDLQPIPVHIIPKNEDFTISLNFSCPRYDQLVSAQRKYTPIAQYVTKHESLIDQIVNISGLSMDSWDTILDTLFCQYVHNLSLPEWKSVLPFNVVKSLRDVSAASKFSSPEMARLKGGSLLKELIENMKKGLNSSSHRHVYLFSGHDSTLVALLRVLDVYDKKEPSYTACVMVELWRRNSDGTPYIRIIYRNETDSNNTITLQIPGCSKDCSLRDFVRILGKYIPGDIQEECKIENETQILGITAAWSRLRILVLVSTLAFLLLVLFILSCILYRGRGVPSYKPVPTIDDDL